MHLYVEYSSNFMLTMLYVKRFWTNLIRKHGAMQIKLL